MATTTYQGSKLQQAINKSSSRINNPNAPISKKVQDVIHAVRGGGGSNAPQTTQETPTPSAENIVGQASMENPMSSYDIHRLQIVAREKGLDLYQTDPTQGGFLFTVPKGTKTEDVYRTAGFNRTAGFTNFDEQLSKGNIYGFSGYERLNPQQIAKQNLLVAGGFIPKPEPREYFTAVNKQGLDFLRSIKPATIEQAVPKAYENVVAPKEERTLFGDINAMFPDLSETIRQRGGIPGRETITGQIFSKGIFTYPEDLLFGGIRNIGRTITGQSGIGLSGTNFRFGAIKGESEKDVLNYLGKPEQEFTFGSTAALIGISETGVIAKAIVETTIGISGVSEIYSGYEKVKAGDILGISDIVTGAALVYPISKSVASTIKIRDLDIPQGLIPMEDKGGEFLPKGKKEIKIKIEKGDYGAIYLEPNFNSGDFIRLYHGTEKGNVPNILKEGLKSGAELGYKKEIPGWKEEPYVSLTLDKEIAKAYAGETGKIIEVTIPKSEFQKAWDNYAFQDPYSSGEPNIAFSKSIPSKYLSVLGESEIINKAEGTYNIKLLGLEFGKGRGLVLGYESPEGFGFGRPDILEPLRNLPETTEIKIGSVLETKTIQRALQDEGLDVTARAKSIIKPTQTILRKTINTNSAFINKDFLYTSTERLPQEGVKVLLDIAKEDKGTLFGSKSRAFQLAQEYNINEYFIEKQPVVTNTKSITSPFEKDLVTLSEVKKSSTTEYTLNKVPRDIELRFDEFGEEDLQVVTDKTVSRLKELGTIKEGKRTFELGTAREIKDTPFAIEAKVDGVFEKVAEFKGKKEIIDKEEVPEFVAGFKKVGKTMEVDGITTTRLNEELRGVTQGVLRVRIDKDTGKLDIYPSPKRLKDIGSVSVSARTLEMSKKFPSSKLRGAIEEFESLFPEGLVREQVSKVLKEDKDLIADFSGTEKASYGFSNIIQGTKYFNSNVGMSSIIKSDILSPKSFTSFSISPSMSRLLSVSKSVSSSLSISPSMSISSSASMSSSPSKSTSVSKSVSVSMSISPSISRSPSTSTSPSPNITPDIYEDIYPTLEGEKQNKKGYGNIKGFDVFVKEPKSKTFNRISDHALSKNDALNFMAFEVDNSTARSGFIKQVNKKPKPLSYDIPDQYFNEIEGTKLRPYKVRQGKKISIPGYIEKSMYSIDTTGEKKQLSAFKVKAQLNKGNNFTSYIMNL